MVLAAKVAHLARQTRRGYWETLDHLGNIESRYGRSAVVLELELALAMTQAEAKAKARKRKRGSGDSH